MGDVRIFDSSDALAKSAAELVIEAGLEAVRERGLFRFVLSGGGTPEPVYRLLASPPYQDQRIWQDCHIFWGDERCVAPDDPGSNYGQARRLFLSHVSVPNDQIHRIRGELGPELAAAEYRRLLASLADDGRKWPRFDLALMGMGDDGHTASLFPGPIRPEEERLAAIAVIADYNDRPAERVTLTPGAFNSARNVLFLVAGRKKAEAVAAVLQDRPDPERFPAARIKPTEGSLIWFLDRPAATLLV